MRIRKDKSGLDAVRTPSDLDIAWAAGVYEGEGSCVKSGNSFGVSVAQKDPEMLYRLRDLFGGTVKEYENNRGTLANKFQPVTIYAWRVCGDRGRIFLAAIYSYLTSRRKVQIEATSARMFIEQLGSVPRDGALVFIQARLNEHVLNEREAAHQRRKAYQKKFYEDRKTSDPTFMKKRRESTASWRKRSKVVAIA